MKHLTLSFFGAFQATLDGKPLTYFRSGKVQGLLIYLGLTAQQAHGRDVLATLFWPEESETVAKQNLRQSLYRLRRLLGDTDGENFLHITRTTIQFNNASSHSLDVADFFAALEMEELETAVSLYHGDLLSGYSCDSLPFDDWLRQERERLHRLALESLSKLTTDNLAQANFPRAQQYAQKQLALEPWREEAHRQLMQALAALGERTAALAQYETCRAALADELGVEPATETAVLAQRIRADQIKRPFPQQLPNPNERQRLKIPFVGRKEEYETLVNAYQRLSRDGCQLVTVVGNAGMGKTRLTEQFVTWAATQGADVLNGRSYETSAGLSYQPLTHLLRQRIERENAPEDLLSDLWLAQLTRLLPELRDRYPDLPRPTQEEATARQHLFEAITRLGLALAERRPVVLFIDDWHWADSASMDVLHYAVQRWAEEKAPILLLLTLRQEALTDSPDLQSRLAQLKRTVTAVPITIEALSPSETTRLIQSLFSPEAENGSRNTPALATPSSLTQFSHWLFAQTHGQPLFLTEALKALVEDGIVRPDPANAPGENSGQAVWQMDWSLFDAQKAESRILAGVREIVQGWLARLSPPAVELLTATAVLSQSATFDKLCRVSGLEEQQAVTVLEELLNRQLLLETDAGQTMTPDPIYAFSHQKVSAVVYTEAGTARRRLLHRRAFETLQASGAAADCANHALQAGLTAEIIRYSLIAGNEAMALFAVRVALPHYETAWRIAEQKGWPQIISGADKQMLYTGLGRAYELIDEWAKAEEIYKAMIAYAQSIASPAMECVGLNRLGTVYSIRLIEGERGVVLLERAKTLAEQNGDRRQVAEAELNLANAAFQNHDFPLTLHHAEQALGIARELDHPRLLARHLSILGYVYIQQRKWAQLEASAIEASRLYTEIGQQVMACESERNVGYAQMLNGKPQESLVTLEKTVAFSRQIDNLWGETEATWKLTLTLMDLGHYGRAVKLGKKAIEMARQLGIPMMLDLTLIVGSIVQQKSMSLAAAQETLLEIVTAAKERRIFEVIWDWTLSELCVASALAGNWQPAAKYARQRLQAREDDSLLPMSLSGWHEIEALLRNGDGELAHAEVERVAGLVGSNRRYQLPLLRSQAVLAQWDGDVAQAISHLQAALALAQEIGLPGEEWPILGALGGLYAEPEKARQAYREAGEIIHRLAETIDDEGLREGFLTAVSIQSILQKSTVA